MSILLIIGGIEPNPGPTGRGSTRSTSARQAQRTSLSSSQSQSLLDTDESGDIRVTRSIPQGHAEAHQDDSNVVYLLNCMRSDLNSNMSEIKDNLKTLNTKVDTISDTCEFLKTENETLKKQNESLCTKVKDLEIHIDNIEGQSRRNNLLFHGIKGDANESWDVSERKIRNFITEELQMPEGETFDLERAHRLRLPGNRNDGPIITKFTKYKDRESVMNSARRKLDGRSQYRVAEDFTPRVRQARRALGEDMVRARNKGYRASIKFDKLIIDDKIYKYDEQSQKPKLIGRTSSRNQNPPPPPPAQVSSQMSTQQPRISGNSDTDTELGGEASSDILL
ncbi:MAG: hypothetical protein ABW185_06975 [Sedimenticola sp.]